VGNEATFAFEVVGNLKSYILIKPVCWCY